MVVWRLSLGSLLVARRGPRHCGEPRCCRREPLHLGLRALRQCRPPARESHKYPCCAPREVLERCARTARPRGHRSSAQVPSTEERASRGEGPSMHPAIRRPRLMPGSAVLQMRGPRGERRPPPGPLPARGRHPPAPSSATTTRACDSRNSRMQW